MDINKVINQALQEVEAESDDEKALLNVTGKAKELKDVVKEKAQQLLTPGKRLTGVTPSDDLRQIGQELKTFQAGEEQGIEVGKELGRKEYEQELAAQKTFGQNLKNVGKAISKTFQDMPQSAKYGLAAAAGIGAGIGALKLARKLRGKSGPKM